jgi:hypothetical protein
MIYESAAAAAVAAGGGAAAVGTVGDRYLPQGAVEGRYGAFVGTGRRTDRDARPAGGGSHQQLVAACTFLHFEACWLDCAMHVPAGPLQEWLMCGPKCGPKAASMSAPLLPCIYRS